MGNVVGSGGEGNVESGTKRLITEAADHVPVDVVAEDDDDCCKRRCHHHFQHRHVPCRDGLPSAPTNTEDAMAGAHRPASRAAITSGPSRHRVQPLSVFSPPKPLALDGRRTLSPVHYARATSEECPMLCANGPAATWCQHHIQKHSTTAGIAGAAVPLGVVSLRHLWFFSCSLLFVGATVSLVSAALAVVAWRLLHEPTGSSEMARNASSAVVRAALASSGGGEAARNSTFTDFADHHQSPTVTAKPRGNADVSSSPQFFGCATPSVAQDDVALPVE